MRISVLAAAFLATGIASAATPVNGWYSSVFGGVSYIPDNIDALYLYGSSYLVIKDSGYRMGYNVGGRFGYQSNPIRYEGEYTFLHANLSHFEVNSVYQSNITGFSSANLLMANLYYDFPEMLPAISPFLGGGIGYALIQSSLYGTSPLYTTYLSVKDNVFAYQGTAGLTYNFAENYAINISYRYVATGKPDGFGKVFQAHIASAGAVYRFDQASYK